MMRGEIAFDWFSSSDSKRTLKDLVQARYKETTSGASLVLEVMLWKVLILRRVDMGIGRRRGGDGDICLVCD
jgi:hypothetical protein